MFGQSIFSLEFGARGGRLVTEKDENRLKRGPYMLDTTMAVGNEKIGSTLIC